MWAKIPHRSSQMPRKLTQIERRIVSEFSGVSAVRKEEKIEVPVPGRHRDRFEDLVAQEGWEMEYVGCRQSERGWMDLVKVW